MAYLLGLVILVSPASSIHKWDGIETVGCTIGLHDMSSYSIDITLWGEHFQIQGAELTILHDLPTPPSVVVKDAVLHILMENLLALSPTLLYL